MALFVSEKNEIIAAVNADLPREQIPYIDEPDGRAYYEELLAMRDAYGMAAFNLLEDEPDNRIRNPTVVGSMKHSI